MNKEKMVTLCKNKGFVIGAIAFLYLFVNTVFGIEVSNDTLGQIANLICVILLGSNLGSNPYDGKWMTNPERNNIKAEEKPVMIEQQKGE